MRLIGLGIDLLSLSRAARFLKAHRSKLKRLLSPPEIKQLAKRRLTKTGFAKMLSAKEAFFKALNQSWMGLDAFRAIHLRFRGKNSFEAAVLPGPFSKKTYTAEGSFFKAGDLLGAQVILWSR